MPRVLSASLHTTLVDGHSLFGAAEAIGSRFGRPKVTIDYAALYERLSLLRTAAEWEPASINPITLSIDPASEGQQRFLSMVKHSGFEPDTVFYRDVFVSLPPGRTPNESDAKSPVSLASRINYIIGLMARHPGSQFLVVSHSFEHYWPLIDLASRLEKGKVGLAYFGSLLDFRWRLAGLLDNRDEKLPIEFFDLDNFAFDLMGVELTTKSRDQTPKSPFSRF